MELVKNYHKYGTALSALSNPIGTVTFALKCHARSITEGESFGRGPTTDLCQHKLPKSTTRVAKQIK